MMNKAFEKILERLEKERIILLKNNLHQAIALNFAKGIVQEVAEEYNGGWIPCSDDSSKLPKENEKVRVTVWTGIEKIGFMQYGKWFVYSSEGVAEATIVAWQPTEPFKERD